MLKMKKLLKKFSFEILGEGNLSSEEMLVKGVGFFSDLFNMWKDSIEFKNKVVICDQKIVEIIIEQNPLESLKEFFEYLEKQESVLLVFINFKENIFKTKYNELLNLDAFIFTSSSFSKEELNATLINYIYRKNAEVERIHGSLMSIYGEGVIIIGESGIGKSELVLNLLEKNHLFVADDALDIVEFAGELFGKSSKAVKNFLEIRGIGIIDIKRALGIESILLDTKISLVIELKHLSQIKNKIDRLGTKIDSFRIHNQNVPKITIPVSEGRSLSSIVEMAVIVHKMKKYDGYDFLKEFNKNIDSLKEEGEE